MKEIDNKGQFNDAIRDSVYKLRDIYESWQFGNFAPKGMGKVLDALLDVKTEFQFLISE